MWKPQLLSYGLAAIKAPPSMASTRCQDIAAGLDEAVRQHCQRIEAAVMVLARTSIECRGDVRRLPAIPVTAARRKPTRLMVSAIHASLVGPAGPPVAGVQDEAVCWMASRNWAAPSSLPVGTEHDGIERTSGAVLEFVVG